MDNGKDFPRYQVYVIVLTKEAPEWRRKIFINGKLKFSQTFRSINFLNMRVRAFLNEKRKSRKFIAVIVRDYDAEEWEKEFCATD